MQSQGPKSSAMLISTRSGEHISWSLHMDLLEAEDIVWQSILVTPFMLSYYGITGQKDFFTALVWDSGRVRVELFLDCCIPAYVLEPT